MAKGPKRAGKSQHPRKKAGTSKEAAALRKALFVEAYIQNNGNGTQAAIDAGFSPKSAKQQASRLLTDVNVQAEIARRSVKAIEKAELTTERTLQEVARVAYFDIRKLFKPDGSLVPVHELDADTAGGIASIEVDELQIPAGPPDEELEGQPHGGALKRSRGKTVIGFTRKVKMWDKNSALEKAMKYHGLYEKDNAQRVDALGELLDKVDGSVLRPAGA